MTRTVETLPRASIFDFDGTLCDVTAALALAPTGDARRGRDMDAWAPYHLATLDCPPHPWAHRLAQIEAAMGHAVLVVTARDERWRPITQAWLERHPIPHLELLMRADGDPRPDDVVKAEILADLRTRYDVRLAVDDRPSVVDFWKASGIPTVTVPGWPADAPVR